MVVLDTSALLYWTLDPEQLSSAVKKAIEDADRLVISSTSVWEIGLKVKRGKVVIPLSISEYFSRLERLKRLEVVAVDVRTWMENLDLA